LDFLSGLFSARSTAVGIKTTVGEIPSRRLQLKGVLESEKKIRERTRRKILWHSGRDYYSPNYGGGVSDWITKTRLFGGFWLAYEVTGKVNRLGAVALGQVV